MGFDCVLTKVFEFIYHAKLDNGLYEHEYDHVMVGTFNDRPTPNRDEVDEWKWVDLMTIKLEMGRHPEDYTYWFRTSFDELCRSINSNNHFANA
jgi:isopentenyl-diphosphate delta-isomerase